MIEKQQIYEILYVSLMIVVIIACIVAIFYISGHARSCVHDPIKFYQDFMLKKGNSCICSKEITIF